MATISENLNKVLEAKNNIKQAIIDKGVDMTDIPFEEYSSKIGEIQSGGGDGNANVFVSDESLLTYINGDKVNKYDYDLSYNNNIYSLEGIINPHIQLIEKNSLDAANKLVCETRTSSTYNCYCGNSTTTTSTASVKLNVESYSPVTYNDTQLSNLTGMLSGQQEVIRVLNLPSTATNTKMYRMFYGCSRLTSIEGVEKINTNNITDVSEVFSGCSNLTTLDLSGWNTSNVTSMSRLFYGCTKLTSIEGISNWNTSSVNTLERLFYQCSSLTTLDLSGWDTSNVTSTSYTFYLCSSLTSLDLSGWDLSNNTNTASMFYSASKLTKIYMKGCNETTINKIRNASSRSTIITDKTMSEDIATQSDTESNKKYIISE